MDPCPMEHVLLLSEFSTWQDKNPNRVFCSGHCITEDGRLSLNLSIGDSKFQLLCPTNYPNHEDHFYTEADSMEFWCHALNEFTLDSPKKLTLDMVLSKALSLQTPSANKSCDTSSESENENEGDQEQYMMVDFDSDEMAEWEFMICKKKKDWRAKEGELRLKMNQPKTSDMFDGKAMDHPTQVFSNSAASGILTNDLIRIMESKKYSGINAEPVDDNICKWSVFLTNFDSNSQLAKDLKELKKLYGYDYIQLQLDFTMDLYPFYPPLLRFIRPKLKSVIVIKIACMNLLKLSYWNPARDMKSVLHEIKEYIENYGSIDINNKRNDIHSFPTGSYSNIEKHMLRLATVSEIQPRSMSRTDAPDLVAEPMPAVLKKSKRGPRYPGKKLKKTPSTATASEFETEALFPPGTGYSTSNSSHWDMNAFLAAGKEKDLQIEIVLKKILHDLKAEEAGEVLSPEFDVPCSSTDSYSSFNFSLKNNVQSNENFEDQPKTSSHSTLNSTATGRRMDFYKFVTQNYNMNYQKLDMLCHPKQCNIITNPIFDSGSQSQAVEKLKNDRFRSAHNITMACNKVSKGTSSMKNTIAKVGDQCGRNEPDIVKDNSSVVSSLNGNMGSLQELSPSTSCHYKLMLSSSNSDIYNAIEESSLLPFITSKLIVDTFLEISQHRAVYSCIIDILMEIASNPHLVQLLGDLPMQDQSIADLMKIQEDNATSVLDKLSKVMGSPDTLRFEDYKVEGQEEEQLARNIIAVSQQIQLQLTRFCHSKSSDKVSSSSNYQTLGSSSSHSMDSECGFSLVADESLEAVYKNALKDLQFCSTDIDIYTHSFKHNSAGVMPGQFVRIAQEFATLSKSLPLELSSAIFVRTDDTKCHVMRALIIGAEGTPYSGGCFSFDIYLERQYPAEPPKIVCTTTGGGTISFNPNLYANGKICLSLLGTWSGRDGEQWTSASTLLQVLISIQSLILVAEPYFNEPGYEYTLGTARGRKYSKNYNEELLPNVLKYAMIEQIRHPTPGFEEVIRTHFRIKKDRIISELEQYASLKGSVQLETLKKELDQLTESPKSPKSPKSK